MKNKLKITLVLLFILNLYSSSQITRDWIKQYNGTANMFDVPARILIDNANNIYIAGYSGVLQSSSADYILLKYSPEGNLILQSNYDANNYYDGIIDALIDSENNIYVTGESRLDLNNSDYCTIKYDSAGNIIWNMRYDGPPHRGDIPRKMFKDSQDYVYVTGVSAQYFSPVQTTGDILTIKYNSEGDTIWNAIYNNNGAYTEENPSSICVSFDGSIYITGMCGPGVYDIVTLKYNNAGNLTWVKKYNGPVNRDDYGVDLKADSSGNVYVLGSTTSQLSENFDIILLKYNMDGDTLWVRKYNGVENGRDFGRSMILEPDGIYITGVCEYSTSQNSDIVLLKYNYEGILLWASYFEGAAQMQDTPAKLLKDPFGYYFVVGSSARGVLNWDFVIIRYDSYGNQIWYDTYNSQSNFDDNGTDLAFGLSNDMYFTGTSLISGPNDIVTIKYNNVTGLKNLNEKIPVHFSLLQNYPNPFNPKSKIKFEISKLSEAKLIVYDVLGREVQTLINEQLSPGTYEVEFDGSNLPSGVYYYRLEANNYNVTKKMVLIK